MPPARSMASFPVAYVVALVIQVPFWILGGLLWGTFMVAGTGFHPHNALVRGLAWGGLMWATVGNLLALGLAWRPSARLPAPDREAFRAAIRRVCDELKLVVLAESPDGVALGPGRALMRVRRVEVRIEFEGGEAVLSAPALSFWTMKGALGRAMAETPTVGRPGASPE